MASPTFPPLVRSFSLDGSSRRPRYLAANEKDYRITGKLRTYLFATLHIAIDASELTVLVNPRLQTELLMLEDNAHIYSGSMWSLTGISNRQCPPLFIPQAVLSHNRSRLRNRPSLQRENQCILQLTSEPSLSYQEMGVLVLVNTSLPGTTAMITI